MHHQDMAGRRFLMAATAGAPVETDGSQWCCYVRSFRKPSPRMRIAQNARRCAPSSRLVICAGAEADARHHSGMIKDARMRRQCLQRSSVPRSRMQHLLRMAARRCRSRRASSATLPVQNLARPTGCGSPFSSCQMGSRLSSSWQQKQGHLRSCRRLCSRLPSPLWHA